MTDDFEWIGQGCESLFSARFQKVPLTLYDPWRKFGFTVVLVTQDGELEQSTLEEAGNVLQAKALPDGADGTKVRIVVPLREHALAVHDQVVAAVFSAALYPGESGQFWEPIPNGPWLSRSAVVP